MDLPIPINAELEAQIREQAAASGRDVVEYVVEALKEKLAHDADESPVAARQKRWLESLDKWIASHADVRHAVDDSRDTIYHDRGA